MALIYKFGKYHAPRLLRIFLQQAGYVVCQIDDLNKYYKKISENLCSIAENHRSFYLELDIHISQLEKAKEFARRCSAACELKSIEQMTQKRDQIIQGMPKK